MKRLASTFWGLFLVILNVMAQATQPCLVKKYNQKQAKTPLAGVQVMVNNAGSAVSDVNGSILLTFRTLKPGDKVKLISAKKEGFELMNKTAVEQWNISRNNTPFSLVLVESNYFFKLKEKLTETSTESYKTKYEQAVQELEEQKKAGQLMEEEYNKRYDELETKFQDQLTNLDNYIDQFARIDLSEVSADEQRILDMVQDGQIDEAVKAYEQLDISGKLRQARENKKALVEARTKIAAEEARQDEAINDLKAKQKREIATLKLAGGKNNYDKVGRMLKENALADTMDYEALLAYSDFALSQKDYGEAEQFLSMSLTASGDDPIKQAHVLTLLGNMYSELHDFDNAEKSYLKALESYSKNPEANRPEVAGTKNNLGSLYGAVQDFAKSEEYYLSSLEDYDVLCKEDPDTYLDWMGSTQSNLGNTYFYTQDYAKADEYFQKALKIYTQLFEQDPNTHRLGLAMVQKNYGNVFFMTQDYVKAEEFGLKALENYTQLFAQNPDAYRFDLAGCQNNIGGVYLMAHDLTKAKDYYLQALENYKILYDQYPDVFTGELAMVYQGLGVVYTESNDFDKALENLDRAIELTPDDPANYDSKGEALFKKGDEKGALEMWKKVMELEPNYLTSEGEGSNLYKLLKKKGLIK